MQLSFSDKLKCLLKCKQEWIILKFVNTAPFGLPVVPEVYKMKAASSSFTIISSITGVILSFNIVFSLKTMISATVFILSFEGRFSQKF